MGVRHRGAAASGREGHGHAAIRPGHAPARNGVRDTAGRHYIPTSDNIKQFKKPNNTL